ncbi:rCG24078 [Rattus norvegicus]|uniref:RCG24078 n=1 Tax=Rattus norvegicus TaxID=10116 RepID=A6JST0_RAT|nr:rCG24078 [Rattus norvegicus]
MGQKYLSIGL